MSTTESPSILKAIKRTHSDALPPLCQWSSVQTQAFHCEFVSDNRADLPLSQHSSADFKISASAFEMSKYPDQPSEPSPRHFVQLSEPSARAISGLTNFPPGNPLILCSRERYGPSAFFHDRSQMNKAPKHRKAYTGVELESEALDAVNMAIIIALAQREAKAVKFGNMDRKDVFEVSEGIQRTNFS